MRIATAFAYENSVTNLQLRQQQLSESQQQLTSGKRVNKPSDDPAAAARSERALALQSRTDAEMRALDTSRLAMQFTESALGSAGDLLQTVRERVMSAGNGAYGDVERKSLADAITGLRTELLEVANRSDGVGRYLFGGQGSDQPPFVDSPGGVTFIAADGQTLAATGEGSPLTVDGRLAWMQVDDPANPGTTISVFDVLDRVSSELATPGRTAAQTASTVFEGLRDIDAAASHLSAFRSRAGEVLNRIDGLAGRLAETKLGAQESRSNAEDLDMLQAISDFQTRQTGYDAALKTYSIVQKMSLFDHIS